MDAILSYCLNVENLLASEPGLVNKIVLDIAYPGGGENLGLVLRAVDLQLTILEDAWRDYPVESPNEVLWLNLVALLQSLPNRVSILVLN